MQVGLIGLGVMGSALARNLANRGHDTVVFNRTTEKTQKFITEFGSENLVATQTIEDFISKLTPPRIIFLMIDAGPSVDTVLDGLTPFLSEGDTIIEGGNSYYKDTMRRMSEFEAGKIHYVGCGISGGAEGALNGPSMMPGCSDEAWGIVKPILESIAAKDFQDNPCVTHVGLSGAGHFVKMVHNGIEYALMQVIAEGYDLLKNVCSLNSKEIAEIFKGFNNGKLKSFLVELTANVLEKDSWIDSILDKSGQKGTGKWTVIEALERGVAVPSISEAVAARIISSKKDTRVKLAKFRKPQDFSTSIDLETFKTSLENAIYCSFLLAYAQGFELIKVASSEENWEINLNEVARIWQGGCIIRASLLALYNNYVFEQIISEAITHEPKLNEIVDLSYSRCTAAACMAAGLSYLQNITREKLPANLIQGLRNSFGEHPIEIIR